MAITGHLLPADGIDGHTRRRGSTRTRSTSRSGTGNPKINSGIASAFRFYLKIPELFQQVISDLRQLLDLQFDLTNNGSAEISPVNLMKRMSNLRQLRDPHTMNRLAQMARQRPPPPPPFAIQQPGRFNNFRYPPTPSTFMGAPPPPPNFQLPAKQQPDHHPNLYLGVDGHLQSPRNNERECRSPTTFSLFLFQLF